RSGTGPHPVAVAAIGLAADIAAGRAGVLDDGPAAAAYFLTQLVVRRPTRTRPAGGVAARGAGTGQRQRRYRRRQVREIDRDRLGRRVRAAVPGAGSGAGADPVAVTVVVLSSESALWCPVSDAEQSST